MNTPRCTCGHKLSDHSIADSRPCFMARCECAAFMGPDDPAPMPGRGARAGHGGMERAA